MSTISFAIALLFVSTAGFAPPPSPLIVVSRRAPPSVRVALQLPPPPSPEAPPPPRPTLELVGTCHEGTTAPPDEIALNATLFVALHAFACTGAALASGSADPSAATAVARLAAVAAFVALQQPVSGWLTEPRSSSSESRAMPALDRPIAPLAAVLLFAVAACAPAALAQLAGAPEAAQLLLPAARALPDPGRALDLLAAAPIEEELFFRAWLLSALRRGGLGDAAALAASSVAFAAWHGVGGDGGPLFFAALGGWLGWLYQRSEGNLALPLATHALWNGGVAVGRALLL